MVLQLRCSVRWTISGWSSSSKRNVLTLGGDRKYASVDITSCLRGHPSTSSDHSVMEDKQTRKVQKMSGTYRIQWVFRGRFRGKHLHWLIDLFYHLPHPNAMERLKRQKRYRACRRWELRSRGVTRFLAQAMFHRVYVMRGTTARSFMRWPLLQK